MCNLIFCHKYGRFGTFNGRFGTFNGRFGTIGGYKPLILNAESALKTRKNKKKLASCG
jgi:hypothetical protein